MTTVTKEKKKANHENSSVNKHYIFCNLYSHHIHRARPSEDLAPVKEDAVNHEDDDDADDDDDDDDEIIFVGSTKAPRETEKPSPKRRESMTPTSPPRTPSPTPRSRGGRGGGDDGRGGGGGGGDDDRRGRGDDGRGNGRKPSKNISRNDYGDRLTPEGNLAVKKKWV